jgi:putative phage-type endonuclease
MVTCKDIVQGSVAWHEFRKCGVGASEVAAILQICPYSTPHDVWLSKTGRSKFVESGFAMSRGTELESKIRARFELISLDNFTPQVGIHPTYQMVRASFDGVSDDGKSLLEIKCTSEETFKSVKSGKVPEHYYAQVQAQLVVSGADKCFFFVFNEKLQDHALVEVLPDLELQGRIVAAVLEFWELVKSKTPPPLTDRDFKDVAGDARLEALVNRIRTEHKDLKKPDIDRLKAEAVALGGHNKIVCGDVKISAVNRMGKFSYHKLTIASAKGEVA